MKFGKKAVHTVLALTLTSFLLCASVIGTLMFRPLYYHDIKALDIESESGLTQSEIRENYDALIAYLTAPEDGLLEFPTLPQSDGAQYHFYEVKQIFDLFKYVGIGCFVLGVAGIILFAWKKWGVLYLKLTGILTVAIPLVMGIVVGINWKWAFLTFHRLAFSNNFWIFDPATDPVILMLPDAYFMHCALLILGFVLAGALLCTVLYRVLRKRLPPE